MSNSRKSGVRQVWPALRLGGRGLCRVHPSDRHDWFQLAAPLSYSKRVYSLSRSLGQFKLIKKLVDSPPCCDALRWLYLWFLSMPAWPIFSLIAVLNLKIFFDIFLFYIFKTRTPEPKSHFLFVALIPLNPTFDLFSAVCFEFCVVTNANLDHLNNTWGPFHNKS